MENLMASMMVAYESCLTQYVKTHSGPKKIPAERLARAKPASKLSPREGQIVERVLRGKTNKVIAVELQISEGTVKKTLHNAFVKFGICSRNELLSLCVFDETRYTSLC